jgi:hypothetical protein
VDFIPALQGWFITIWLSGTAYYHNKV